MTEGQTNLCDRKAMTNRTGPHGATAWEPKLTKLNAKCRLVGSKAALKLLSEVLERHPTTLG